MNDTSIQDTKPQADETMRHQAFSRYLPCIARILLGLMFFIFGLNGFLHFIPQPKTMPEVVAAFFGALAKTGYMLPLIFGTQALAGALLLANRFVPLALALIAPVIVNIVAFHAFLQPSGAAMAGVVLVLELYLAWAYREAYRPMLAMRVIPGMPKI
jgi:uncharacterized membrane protein YphA (DoxX/SURF4 family)